MGITFKIYFIRNINIFLNPVCIYHQIKLITRAFIHIRLKFSATHRGHSNRVHNDENKSVFSSIVSLCWIIAPIIGHRI